MSASNERYSDLPATYWSRDDLPEAYAEQGTLEVAQGEEKVVANEGEDDAQEAVGNKAEFPGSQGRNRSLRSKRRWVFAVATVVLILALALGVGLGVGLQVSGLSAHDGSDNDDPSSPGQDQSPIAPSGGALNGSDTAVVTNVRLTGDGNLESDDTQQGLLLVYQHASGELRWMQYTTPDRWEGGTSDQVIATDAKEGTPLDTFIMYPAGPDYPLRLHVFYLDTENRIRQRWTGVGSPTWNDGPLNNMNYTALHADQVALRTGRYNGPIAGVHLNATRSCMKLFAATSNTTIDELAWCSDIEWHFVQTHSNVNGQATPAYTGWIDGSITYVAFTDLENDVQIYWLDSSQSKDSTAAHSLNQWNLASGISISNVDPSAGLSGLSVYGTLIGRSMSDGLITNWALDLTAENSTNAGSGGWSFDPPQMLSSSRIKVTLNPMPHPEQVVLYYQANGSDITMSTRDISSGAVETVAWPIPED